MGRSKQIVTYYNKLVLYIGYSIVQGQVHNNAVEMFRGSEVKIPSEWRHHLSVVIGSETFKISYTKLLVDEWIKEFKLLTKKPEPEPKPVCSSFVGRFKGKHVFHAYNTSASCFTKTNRCHLIWIYYSNNRWMTMFL